MTTVAVRDSEGIEPSAEVTADSLYEAIALGLRAICSSSWAEDITQNFEVPRDGAGHAGRARDSVPQVQPVVRQSPAWMSNDR